MEQERDAKEYSWRWITATALISKSACDLCTVILLSRRAPGTLTIYDGENTQGDIVSLCEGTANRSQEWKPYKPIYCRRGLYLSFDGDCLGCFVQWRPRLTEEG